ncbi:MAG: hypothetical protein JNL02_20520 [Saprospiraceae bacterium]|nr:hypothetical protein [Saprospiraceae bacterium]
MMYLGKEYWYWGMDIEENTLNDTAMIGVMKIPPGKTGRLFRVECFTDSIPFSYKPYKARKGRLTIRYFAFMNADNRLP